MGRVPVSEGFEREATPCLVSDDGRVQTIQVCLQTTTNEVNAEFRKNPQ